MGRTNKKPLNTPETVFDCRRDIHECTARKVKKPLATNFKSERGSGPTGLDTYSIFSNTKLHCQIGTSADVPDIPSHTPMVTFPWSLYELTTAKKANYLFVSVSHPSNVKNIAKSMTIL